MRKRSTNSSINDSRFLPKRDDGLILRSHFETQNVKNISPFQKEAPSQLYLNALQAQIMGTDYNKNTLQFGNQQKQTSQSPNLPPSIEKGSLNSHTRKILKKTTPVTRKLPSAPYKVLNVQNIRDDFYLHLLDWSVKNVVAVGIGPQVFLWNATTGLTQLLLSLPFPDQCTTVRWVPQGDKLVVGTERGLIEIWDVHAEKRVSWFLHHRSRVGVASCHSSLVATGSRDHTVKVQDLREKASCVTTLGNHSQEVCGLTWSPDGSFLASGGNDNKILIWASSSYRCVDKFLAHTAAVKGLAWSPHSRGLLASGGGTADRTIRIWNVLESTCVRAVDTGSQVCNLAWSKNVDEIVSTHGYSQNQITLWSIPSMDQLGSFIGHRSRVLYLAVSPDGENIVTGAGDQTLRFWNLFPPKISLVNDSHPRNRCYDTIR